MYLRWAEQQGFKTEVLDMMEGDGAGIQEVSPWASAAAMPTAASSRSVASTGWSVSRPSMRPSPPHIVLPSSRSGRDLADDEEVEISPTDLQIDTFRASSAGGQHMQKNETAVRITHIPSGIIVACQKRAIANAEPGDGAAHHQSSYQIQEEERQKQIDDLRGEHVRSGLGQPDSLLRAASVSNGEGSSHGS